MIKLFPWQKTQIQQIIEMSKQKRLPHALLLSGPDGIGLKKFALFVAANRLCLINEMQQPPCGECQSCQLFLGRSNPDIKLIEPEKEGGQIKIDTIREVVSYASLKSFLNNNMKIIIISQADAMNRSAANSLLKVLEEPSSQSMFILLSHRPSQLLVTIRSRCQKINFNPTYENESIEWVDGAFNNSNFSSDLLLRLAGGGPLKVKKLLEEDYLDYRVNLLKDLDSLNKRNSNPVDIAKNWNEFSKDKIKSAETTIFCLMQLINDLVRLKLCPKMENIVNIDLIEDLHGISNTLDLLKLIRSYDFILLKYKELVGPMNYNSLAILEEIALFWKNYNHSMIMK